MRFWKAHKVIYRVSFTACFSLIRICIQAVLMVQQKEGVVGTESELENMFDDILVLLLVVYFVFIYVGTFWEIVSELVELFKSCCAKKDESEEEKKGK